MNSTTEESVKANEIRAWATQLVDYAQLVNKQVMVRWLVAEIEKLPEQGKPQTKQEVTSMLTQFAAAGDAMGRARMVVLLGKMYLMPELDL